jgi:cell division GTPase FtsZ
MNVASAVHAITLALESSPERSSVTLNSLSNAGESAVVSGSSTGLHAGSMAVANACASTSNDFVGVKSAVMHVEGGIGLSLDQVAETVDKLREEIGLQVPVYVSKERLVGLGQQIKVTIVFCGIGRASLTEATFSPVRLFQRDIVTDQVASVFNTQTPRRTRGPILLPTG